MENETMQNENSNDTEGAIDSGETPDKNSANRSPHPVKTSQEKNSD